MKNISDFNQKRAFGVDLRESRMKKIHALIKKIPPGNLLDIGCSTGEWAAYWKSKGWQSFGIDVNESAAQTASQKGIIAKKCDLNNEKIPFEENVFDLVFAGEVIEHLVDGDGFLNEINRCLKPNGYLILSTPNLASFENRVRLLLGIYPKWVDYRLAGNGHIRAFIPSVLKAMLEEHHFKILKRTGNFVPFLPQSIINDIRLPFLSITGTLFPNIAMDIIIMAQKTL